jgi:trk system potassium uptake protein TrkH
MNHRIIAYTVGRIIRMEAILLLLPLLVAILYRESTVPAFLYTIGGTALLGTVLAWRKPKNDALYAKEGLLIVAMSWIVLSLLGAMPFFLSGEIPNIIDAFFETVSGFTTTGASILTNVEAMSRGLLFWRSFTHWIGGMGVLVFVLALMPRFDVGAIHIFRAEIPGPTADKIVSKLQVTARILYGIYIAITVAEIALLAFGGMPLFDSMVNTFGTVGTGGFAIKNASIAAYGNLYFEIVITIFMIISGINFNLFYLILLGNFRQAFRSKELRWYLGIMLASMLFIAFNLLSTYESFAEALRVSSFQVASIMTTTGFATANYGTWPVFSQVLLLLLMFIGASAGSTGGGLKVSRVMLLLKSAWHEMRRTIHPHAVMSVKHEGKPMDRAIIQGVHAYFILYIIVFVLSVLLLSLNGFDFATTFSAVLACFNNIGPGIGAVGPAGNYAGFHDAGKLLLSFIMLAGRLELFPILMLFSINMWRNH